MSPNERTLTSARPVAAVTSETAYHGGMRGRHPGYIGADLYDRSPRVPLRHREEPIEEDDEEEDEGVGKDKEEVDDDSDDNEDEGYWV